MRRRLPVLALALLAVLATAGCLASVRDAVGQTPAHRWEDRVEASAASAFTDPLDQQTVPERSDEADADLPDGTTDLRLEVTVEVGTVGNVTVTLEGPDGQAYARSFSTDADDAYQETTPASGTWTVQVTVQGEASATASLRARVPTG